MIATVEISYYPLQEDYKEHIKSFIRTLNAQENIVVSTTCMSTTIKGEYKYMMEVLVRELGHLYDKVPASATVMKIIPQDLEVGKFLHF